MKSVDACAGLNRRQMSIFKTNILDSVNLKTDMSSKKSTLIRNSHITTDIKRSQGPKVLVRMTKRNSWARGVMFIASLNEWKLCYILYHLWGNCLFLITFDLQSDIHTGNEYITKINNSLWPFYLLILITYSSDDKLSFLIFAVVLVCNHLQVDSM